MNYLLPAWRRDGRTVPQPVIVETDTDGTVIAHHPLTGHEPHSTVHLNAVLNLDTLTIEKLTEAEASAK